MRPFFVYGPGQRGMLIRVLTDRVLAGETVTVRGNPGMRINPIYVGDAARAIEAAACSTTGPVSSTSLDARTFDHAELVELMADAAAGTWRRSSTSRDAGGDLIADTERMATG